MVRGLGGKGEKWFYNFTAWKWDFIDKGKDKRSYRGFTWGNGDLLSSNQAIVVSRRLKKIHNLCSILN